MTFVCTFKPPLSREDMRRAGVETASRVVILDEWTKEGGGINIAMTDSEAIMMHHLLMGIPLRDKPIVTLGTASTPILLVFF